MRRSPQPSVVGRASPSPLLPTPRLSSGLRPGVRVSRWLQFLRTEDPTASGRVLACPATMGRCERATSFPTRAWPLPTATSSIAASRQASHSHFRICHTHFLHMSPDLLSRFGNQRGAHGEVWRVVRSDDGRSVPLIVKRMLPGGGVYSRGSGIAILAPTSVG